MTQVSGIGAIFQCN